MIAARSASVIAVQPAISSAVRLQPTQRPAAGWITQILTQGEAISARRQIASVFSGQASRSSAPCKI